MNLVLRLIRVITHAFLRSPLGFLDISQLTFRVWPHDLDINWHMTNSRYLSLMDLGRTDFLIRSGLAKALYQHKWSPVLGSATIRWRKSLNLFDRVRLETQILGWNDKWVYIEQRVIAKGIVHSNAIVKGLFMGKEGTIPFQQVVDLLKPGLKSPPLPPTVNLWIEMEAEMRNRLKE